MKVALFEFNQNPWHLGLAFEIAQREISAGNQVEFYFLGHNVESNYRNIYIHPNRLVPESLLPESRIGKKLEKKFTNQFKYFNKILLINQQTYPEKELYYRAKFAASNDLIDELRDSEPNFELYGEALLSKISAYKKTYTGVINIIKFNKVDKIYTFNGRFLHEKATWDAANDQEVPCYFHEKFEPNWGNRYWIFKKGVHNSAERASVINNFWEAQSIDNKEKSVIANKWLENRRNRKSQSYTRFQQEGQSITGLNKFILFLHSSDDELIASGLGFSEFWGRQEQAILKLDRYFQENSELKLVIRVHPNLLTRSKNERNRWFNIFNQLNAIIIQPESTFDTYQLIIDSQAVITFGSTAGIEASLLGKPSLLLGPALHGDLGATISVQSEEVLTRILKDLKDNRIEITEVILQALKYAFFYARGGEKFIFNKIIGNIDSQDPEMKVLGIKLKYRSRLQKLVIFSSKFL